MKTASSVLIAAMWLLWSAGANAVPVEHDLEITKVLTTTDYMGVSDSALFTITVTNDGPSDATSVEVTDVWDAGSVVGVGLSQGSFTHDFSINEVYWDVGALTSGALATMTLLFDTSGVLSGTVLTNTAEISAFDGADPDLGNNRDSASLTVPEPTTLALLGAGLIGLAWCRRRA